MPRGLIASKNDVEARLEQVGDVLGVGWIEHAVVNPTPDRCDERLRIVDEPISAQLAMGVSGDRQVPDLCDETRS